MFGKYDSFFSAKGAESFFQPVVAGVEAVNVCNLGFVQIGYEFADVVVLLRGVNVFHRKSFALQVCFVVMHRRPLKEKLFFVKGILPEKQKFFN